MQHAKPMLSIEGQLDLLAEKGITYNITSRDKAGFYLGQANNYFRLAAYRMLFPNLSIEQGVDRYEGVDFAHLAEVASVDNRLRYVLLHMMLDVEHYAKVRLLSRAIDQQANGYQIVIDFAATPQGDRVMNDILSRHRENEYTGALYEKYKDEMPLWVLFEMLSYTHLCKFYKFCGERWNDNVIADEAKIFSELISMRNAAAHSNCLLNGIETERIIEGHKANSVAYRLYHDIPNRETVQQIIENVRLTQISLLFLLHKNFAVGEDSRERMASELENLSSELSCKFEMFEDFAPITRRFQLLCDLITVWQSA